MNAWRWWAWRLVGLALVTAVLYGRYAVVREYHAPAGDGVQYYRLANELRTEHRYAYGLGMSNPPSYSRLPGYPLFTALGAPKPRPMDQHVKIVTRWNVLLDLLTALTVLLILRDRGFGPLAQLGAVVLTLVHPALVIASSYAITESLATFLATVEIWLILRMDRRPIAYAVLAGIAAGIGQLVRADALTVAPALGVVLLLLDRPFSIRLQAAGAFVATALIVFSPWPIRNWIVFGSPHPLACTWRTMHGEPLPTGPIEWARTWSASDPGDALFDLRMANRGRLDRPGNLNEHMWDDEEEHQRVLTLKAHYDERLLSPDVSNEFHQLAVERTRKHPFRTFVTLPAKRVLRLWSPTPSWELPFKSKRLDQPAKRARLEKIERAWFWLALGGAIVAFRRRRGFVLTVLAVLAARSLLYSFAIPHGTTGRYLIEAVPLLIVLGIAGTSVLAFTCKSFLLERRRHGYWGHQARQGPPGDAGAEARGPKGASLTSTAR
jgi:hypothetical protein